MNLEQINTLKSNDHLPKGMQAAIENNLLRGEALPTDYCTHGIAIEAQAITPSDPNISTIQLGDQTFAIAPMDIEGTIAYPTKLKIENNTKQIPYLVRRANQPSCPNDGSPQNDLATLELSKPTLDCESCGSPIALVTKEEKINQEQVELGDLTYPIPSFTGKADQILGQLVERIGDQNTEEISKIVKSLGINLDESMIRAALPIIKRVLESKAFNITEIISGKAVDLPEEIQGFLTLAKTFLGDKWDSVANQLELVKNTYFGYGDQEVNIYKLPRGADDHLFLTPKVAVATSPKSIQKEISVSCKTINNASINKQRNRSEEYWKQLDLPNKEQANISIIQNASYKYPLDKHLSQQEVETQTKAYDQLATLPIAHDDYGHMMIHSRAKWSEDFNMVLYEYEKQKKAYEWIQTQEVNWEHMAKAELKWLTKSANYDMVVYEYIKRMRTANLPLISKAQTIPPKSINSGKIETNTQSPTYKSLEPTIHELTVRKWGVNLDHQQAILEQEPLFASKCIETAREFADRLRSNYGSDCADSKIIENAASSFQATMRRSSIDPIAWHTDLNNLLENLKFVKFLDVMHPEAKDNWLANFDREVRFNISTLPKIQNVELNQALSILLAAIGEKPSPKDTSVLWFKELNEAIYSGKNFNISTLITSHPYYKT